MKKILSSIIIFMLAFVTLCADAVQTQKRWANPKHLTTYIQPGLERSEMMKRAFAEWSRLTKNKVVFYYVDSPEKADITVKFVDKVNASNGDVSGLTKCQYSQLDDTMKHAEILIPAYTSAGRKLGRDDVYTSMLHEIGHAIGIVVHSTNPNNIMYPRIDVKREITKYDLGELYRIYGWKQN